MTRHIAFWPHVRDIATASFRLRCHQIFQGMLAQGVDCGLYDKSAPPPSTLVLSKRYDKATLAHAVGLKSRHGTRLVLDICDNHFYSNREEPVALARAASLRDAVRAVDLVVASSDELANVIRSEAGIDIDVTVVADTVEYPSTPAQLQRFRSPVAELGLLAMRRWLQSPHVQNARKIVWFGNHGSGFADGGMADLLRIKEVVQGTAADCPVTLTVISNSKDKFRKLIGDWDVPVFYLEWHQNTFSRALSLHEISVIPISQNPFTICKTSNRVATSLLHGLAVIADSIPSYREFSDCVELDNWESGFRTLCADQDVRMKSVAAGVRKIESQFSREAIIQRWIDVLVGKADATATDGAIGLAATECAAQPSAGRERVPAMPEQVVLPNNVVD